MPKTPHTYGDLLAAYEAGGFDTHRYFARMSGTSASPTEIVHVDMHKEAGAVRLYRRRVGTQSDGLYLALSGHSTYPLEVTVETVPKKPADDGRTYSEADIVEKAPTSDAGRKFDAGKPDPTLLPPKGLLEVVRGLTVGAQKYDRDNWHRVPGARIRYMAAALRHLLAYQSGERIDQETQVNHLALACCSLLFLLGFDMGDAPEPPPLPSPTKKDTP